MQSTRRLVLAALIKHSGCGAYCVAESDALIAGRKAMTERPHALLTDVWRCAQVMEMGSPPPVPVFFPNRCHDKYIAIDIPCRNRYPCLEEPLM